jgi:hypothetical protein
MIIMNRSIAANKCIDCLIGLYMNDNPDADYERVNDIRTLLTILPFDFLLSIYKSVNHEN